MARSLSQYAEFLILAARNGNQPPFQMLNSNVAGKERPSYSTYFGGSEFDGVLRLALNSQEMLTSLSHNSPDI